jgi:hypothetical protein
MLTTKVTGFGERKEKGWKNSLEMKLYQQNSCLNHLAKNYIFHLFSNSNHKSNILEFTIQP